MAQCFLKFNTEISIAFKEVTISKEKKTPDPCMNEIIKPAYFVEKKVHN